MYKSLVWMIFTVLYKVILYHYYYGIIKYFIMKICHKEIYCELFFD